MFKRTVLPSAVVTTISWASLLDGVGAGPSNEMTSSKERTSAESEREKERARAAGYWTGCRLLDGLQATGRVASKATGRVASKGFKRDAKATISCHSVLEQISR